MSKNADLPMNKDAATLMEDFKKFNLKDFLTGLGPVWQKIEWPTRQQLFIQVVITIAVTAFATLMIFGFDQLFGFLIRTFVKGV